RAAPVLTDAARTAGFTNEAGIDGTIRFLKNLTGLWALQECVREWEAAESVDWQTLEHEARAAGSATTTIDLEDPRFLARGGMEARLRSYYQEKQRGVPATRGAL